MTVLLVLFMLVGFLTVDYFVNKAREARAARAAETTRPGRVRFLPVPDGVGIAANHLWTRTDGNGDVLVGMDEFLARMIGAAEQIIVPADAAAPILVRNGGRALALRAPVAGTVVAANPALANDPGGATRDPYAAWIVRLRPAQGTGSPVRSGRQAAEWLQEQFAAARDFFLSRSATPALAALQDGGQPADGVLRHFQAGVWQEFEAAFTTLPTPKN
jgi:glycine cleavage system H protein